MKVLEVRWVWRVENPRTKTGPYNGVYGAGSLGAGAVIKKILGVQIDICEVYSKYHKSHPAPQDDSKIMRRMFPNECCGFESFKSLTDWFPPNQLKNLVKHNQIARRIKVAITEFGEKQLLFNERMIVDEEINRKVEEAMAF